jgi:hypothetical protein
MTLKAYSVFPGDNPRDMGCLLVWAETRNQARMIGLSECPIIDIQYIDMRAWRVKALDGHAVETFPHCIWSNSELLDGVEFYDDEV